MTLQVTLLDGDVHAQLVIQNNMEGKHLVVVNGLKAKIFSTKQKPKQSNVVIGHNTF